jgi:hypothetical protein
MHDITGKHAYAQGVAGAVALRKRTLLTLGTPTPSRDDTDCDKAEL